MWRHSSALHRSTSDRLSRRVGHAAGDRTGAGLGVNGEREERAANQDREAARSGHSILYQLGGNDRLMGWMMRQDDTGVAKIE
jgi:hypothetical protein